MTSRARPRRTVEGKIPRGELREMIAGLGIEVLVAEKPFATFLTISVRPEYLDHALAQLECRLQRISQALPHPR